MDKYKKSVLVPIFFFSFFKFPLTLKELRRYLWKEELTENSIKEIIKEFPKLKTQNDLVWYGDFNDKRGASEKIARKFWRKIKKWSWIFPNVPFLNEVFVTNTLAYNNVNENSDIDLSLIGVKGRLWTMRAWLLFWFNLFDLRVRGENKYGKFSPELFITDKDLGIASLALRNDYYLSFWLGDITPIWSNVSKPLFRQSNGWIKENLPIAWRSVRDEKIFITKKSWFTWLIEKMLSSNLGNKLEKMLYDKQLKIINRNIRKLGGNPEVIVNEDIIKLHFNDRRARVRNYIEECLDDFLGETE